MFEYKMSFEDYLNGIGFDVGPKHRFFRAEHVYVQPNNLYSLRDKIGIETADFIYSDGFLNKTKFFRILIYEWFCVLKPGGHIVISFEDNSILNLQGVLTEIQNLRLLAGKSEIVNNFSEEEKHFVVVRKTDTIKRPQCELNQWTFGIVTNGKRSDLIEKSIQSIRNLNIPEYEIILCGTYDQAIKENIVYVPFTDRDDKGWITRKKNLICEKAKFENIVVIHDRINFPENWFEGMKKWGNYFDVLTCDVYYPTLNISRPNWAAVDSDFNPDELNRLTKFVPSLKMTDWADRAIIGGPIIILKKAAWEIEKWNEDLFWGDWEDIELSVRQGESGLMLRANPYATVNSEIATLILMEMNIHFHENPLRLGKMVAPPGFLFFIHLLDCLGLKRDSGIFQWMVSKVKKIRDVRTWKSENTVR